ncbi:MAG: hypothetical protein K8F25_01375, partial [Fimbriimonadaceae bacterium]|nr:hypothetical protein [Alphaproteobacteria bacterium]
RPPSLLISSSPRLKFITTDAGLHHVGHKNAHSVPDTEKQHLVIRQIFACFALQDLVREMR